MLAAKLATLRSVSYGELLARFLDKEEWFERAGSCGTWYRVELQGFWDDPRAADAHLRITGLINDGGRWRSFAPLSDSFIIAPDGSFVGE